MLFSLQIMILFSFANKPVLLNLGSMHTDPPHPVEGFRCDLADIDTGSEFVHRQRHSRRYDGFSRIRKIAGQGIAGKIDRRASSIIQLDPVGKIVEVVHVGIDGDAMRLLL
jgi:hypothetical protein